ELAQPRADLQSHDRAPAVARTLGERPGDGDRRTAPHAPPAPAPAPAPAAVKRYPYASASGCHIARHQAASSGENPRSSSGDAALSSELPVNSGRCLARISRAPAACAGERSSSFATASAISPLLADMSA